MTTTSIGRALALVLILLAAACSSRRDSAAPTRVGEPLPDVSGVYRGSFTGTEHASGTVVTGVALVRLDEVGFFGDLVVEIDLAGNICLGYVRGTGLTNGIDVRFGVSEGIEFGGAFYDTPAGQRILGDWSFTPAPGLTFCGSRATGTFELAFESRFDPAPQGEEWTETTTTDADGVETVTRERIR